MTNPVNRQPVVLIVDDDPNVREAMTDILEIADIQTLTANNGQEGVAAYAANQTEIDLVILDLMMPVMNGEDALHAMLTIDPSVQVLVSSGYGEAETVRRLIGNGAVDFLQKPFDLNALIGMVRKRLSGDPRNGSNGFFGAALA